MPALSPSSDVIDPRLLLLHPDDTVLVARAAIPAGVRVRIEGAEVLVPTALPLGHKLARRAIASGDKVLKYGAPIGTATAAIAAGAHVHVHNLRSDYTPSVVLDGEGTP